MEAVDVSSREAYLRSVASVARQLDILSNAVVAEPLEKVAAQAARSAIRIIDTEVKPTVRWDSVLHSEGRK